MALKGYNITDEVGSIGRIGGKDITNFLFDGGNALFNYIDIITVDNSIAVIIASSRNNFRNDSTK